MSRVFAYCRTSKVDQNTQNQKIEIEAAGFNIEKWRIVEENISGSVVAKKRPKFSKLLDRLEIGDVLVVTKLDRLGRNVMDILETINTLSNLGVRVHCLALGGVDLTSSAGKMTMQIVAVMAEFERDLLIERTQFGLARAKAMGKKLGRPPALSAKQQTEVIERLSLGEDSISALARRYQTSRKTILRIRQSSLQVNTFNKNLG